MKKLNFRKWIFALLLPLFILNACTTQQHATTVVRDKDDECTVRIVIQLGIDGTDDDVNKVRNQLEDCFATGCFIKCPDDETKGCKIESNVIVKKWSSIDASDRSAFHHIRMVDNDNLPSFVDSLGKPNGSASGGEWRRDVHPRTYCHELLHLCGLDDQYCSRLWDSVSRIVSTEVTCKPPPDPNRGNCCDPRRVPFGRCSSPCEGHDHDLMATLSYDATCQNMFDIVKGAGLLSCPEPCCKKPSSAIPPPGTAIPDDKTYKIGVELKPGYSGLYTTDDFNPNNVIKEKYHGYGIGLGATIDYKLNDKISLNAGLRYQRDINSHHSTTTNTFGNYTYVDDNNYAYKFQNLTLDLNAGYDICGDYTLFGGPTIGYNLAADYRSYGSSTMTYMGNSTTNNYGSKEFQEINPTTPRNVLLGLNLGISREFDCKPTEWHPFFSFRFPFNSRLDIPNYRNLPVELNLGVRIFPERLAF